MKISRFSFSTFLFVLLATAVIGGLCAVVSIPTYNRSQLTKQFPIGSAVQLKGLPIKGNVSDFPEVGFVDSTVELLVVDKYGQGQKIKADAKLLEKQ